MKKNGDYVLWLPSWYPTHLEPFTGDFIQRHAQAVALHQSVTVLFVVRDKRGVVTNDVKEIRVQLNSLHEQIIYYYTPSYFFTFWEKLISYLKYRKLYKKAICNLIKEQGRPTLVQVQVALKSGEIARWIQQKWRIPYVITEHWTGYLKKEAPNFFDLPFYRQQSIQRVFKKSAGVSAVSLYLGQQLKTIFGLTEVTVLPNVVNTSVFKPSSEEGPPEPNFIHISGLSYQKNCEAIIQAFAIVCKHIPAAILHIVGPEKKELHYLVKQLNVADNIFFYNEMPQTELVTLVQKATALILYSRFETFGCVIIEANACGVPVIVSDIPVLRENVIEGFNGTFVAGEDHKALAKVLLSFHQKKRFHPNKIANWAFKKFNYQVVGWQFVQWYQHILNK